MPVTRARANADDEETSASSPWWRRPCDLYDSDDQLIDAKGDEDGSGSDPDPQVALQPPPLCYQSGPCPRAACHTATTRTRARSS
jgi:hypothetical protein